MTKCFHKNIITMSDFLIRLIKHKINVNVTIGSVACTIYTQGSHSAKNVLQSYLDRHSADNYYTIWWGKGKPPGETRVE